MIVVIDCNVVISAGLTDGLPRRVVEHVLAAHWPVVSPSILEEYRCVARRPKFAARVDVICALIDRIATVALSVEEDGRNFGLTDPDDEVYVVAAATAQADFIVTGNSRHFPDGQYGSARVLTVREFAIIAGIEAESR